MNEQAEDVDAGFCDGEDGSEARQRCRSLVNAIDDGITVVDADGEVTFANERAGDLLERSRDALVFADDARWNFVDEAGERLEPGDSPFDRVCARQTPISDQIVGLRRPSGACTWLSVDGAPQWNENDEFDGAVFVFEDVTDQHNAESEVEEILGRVTDAFYALDEDFRFTHVNNRAEELLQATEDELLGEVLWELYPEAAEIDDVWNAFQAAMETQEPQGYELYFDPLEFWVEATIYPSETGVSVYFRDVTERKEREQYLEAAKTQLEAATEAGAVGTWEWYVPEDSFVTGASFARTFGVDPEAAREGVPLDQVLSSIHEDDRDRVAAEIENAVEHCESYEAEYRVWDADDELRWVVARGHVECDEDGNAERFPGALTDITERKRAELQVEKQSRELETLFQVLPVGAVVANADGSLRRANDTARDIWGGDVFDAESVEEYEKYTAVWSDSGEPVGPEDWTMYQVLQGEEVTEPNIYEIDAFDGEHRIIMEHGKPVRDEYGNVSRAVVTLTDITERRAYQRKLKESNERLEQFAYAASHDLQEPLRMVTSYLQLLENRYGDAFDEDGEEFLEFAVDGAERMREMIDGLLEYSRVDTRGDPFEPVDLNGVLEDVQEDLTVRIEESNAVIVTDDLPRVNGDASQLRQLFQNLLSNAIEYRGDEPPQIDVTAEQAGEHWVLTVRDEGVGIDREDAERIFEVFQRLHTHEEHPGTGIGLALCERIVERHGGEIWVESEPNEGATFSFTLPAVRAE
ncbi:PAS domain-containing protein [Saliphagus sp. GCM10025317]